MKITLAHKTLLDCLEAALVNATVHGFDGWQPNKATQKSSGEYSLVMPIDRVKERRR